MRNAVVTPEGDRIRWVELAGEEPARVYVHGLGATSPAYFAASATHPLLAGRRSLLVDLLATGTATGPRGSATPSKRTPTRWRPPSPKPVWRPPS